MKFFLNGNKRFWFVILGVTLLAGFLSTPLRAEEPLSRSGLQHPDPVGLHWSQRTVGNQRQVLLQWRQAVETEPATYTVMYRIPGAPTWRFLANVAPAAGAQAMMDIIGPEVYEILRYDLRESSDDPPLLPEALYDLLMDDRIELGQAAAERYWQVGIAIGRAYIHPVPANARYEYYIAAGGQTQTPLFQPVCTNPGLIPFSPTNLKAAMVVDISADLGVIGSTRPYNAEERYEWDQYQQARRMHGRSFLVWDTPPATTPPGDPFTCSSAVSLRVAGYNLYRQLPGSQNWQQLNYDVENSRSLLVRPGMGLNEGQDDFENYYYQDDVLAQLPPEEVFGSHNYRVCVVDYFGQEHHCADSPITVRELDTPAAISKPEVKVSLNHTTVTLNWGFSDPDETSIPVRYFVTRSDDTLGSPGDWIDLTPNGLTAPHFVDSPPQGAAYWYRVQVRDNAGNWSPPSAPVKGALYDRTPPNFELNGACGSYAWPLTIDDLTNLSETPAQIALYRSFEPNGPWFLIERIEIDPENPEAAEIQDDYTPPWDRQLFYMIEAIDAHGNVSSQETFCMNQPTGNSAVSWPVFTVESGDQSITVDYDDNWANDNDGLTFGDSYSINPQFTITTVVPGPDGNQVTSEPVDPNIHWPHTTQTPPGTIEEHSYTILTEPGKQSGPTVELFVRETNNFLNTNRHMADLGPIQYIEWQPDSPIPAVRVVLQSDCGAACSSRPLVALFRRIPGGNWMQVTTVAAPQSEIGGWVIYDTADLSPDQSYEYTALAFSPTSYEVLGFWQPITLAPLTGSALMEQGSLPPFGGLPSGCQPVWNTPAQANLPGQVALDNGWAIIVDQYAYGTDGCPDEPIPNVSIGQTINNLYAQGSLSNGQGDSWEWDHFYNFTIVKGVNAVYHNGGHIYVDIPDQSVTGPDLLDVTVEAFEFLPLNARAQMVLHLPDAARFTTVDDLTIRWNAVRAVFDQIMTDYTFNTLVVNESKLLLVDENLPWLMKPADGRWFLTQSMILATDVTTSDRLYYPQPYNPNDATADNNAAFLRVPYSSSRVELIATGLNGTFDSAAAIEYMPSLPAGFAIASDKASVTITNSTISDGYLDDPEMNLAYITNGTVTDLMVTSPAVNLHQGVYPNGVKPTEQLDNFTAWGLGPSMPVGTAGRILGEIGVTAGSAKWTGFSGFANRQYLFLAPAIFPSSITTQTVNAPTPAIIAWERLPNPDLPGTDFDPGLNFIHEQGRDNTFYHCYQGDGARFDSNMDMYLRRGGMSESLELLLDDNLERVNQHGYIETVNEFLAVFVDNAIVEHTMLTKLYLPYPSDVTFDLSVESFDGATNCPKSGGFVQPVLAAHHRYWDFTHTPGAGDMGWQYAAPDAVYYEQALDRLPEGLFSVISIGEVQGTGQNGSSAPLNFPLFSQWLPDGDVGRLRLLGPAVGTGDMAVYRAGGLNYALSGILLSRYHSLAMLPGSPPDTLGLDMSHNLNALPAALTDGSGQVTPDSLLNCATAGAGNNIGCGFVVLGGNGMVDFFGEVQPAANARLGGTPVLPPGLLPIAVNSYNGGQVIEAMIQPSMLPFSWPLPTGYLSADLEVYFLHNQPGNRTLLVALEREFEFLPGADDDYRILSTDLSAVVEATSGAPDTLGIFAGYSASQAALRAIAQRHPLTSGLLWPNDNDNDDDDEDHWDELEPHLEDWARLFNYVPNDDRNDANDPVDLAYDTRDGWTINRPFTDAFYVSLSTVAGLDGDAYGLGPVETAGTIAQNEWLILDKGTGFVELEPVGGDYRLDRLAVAAEPSFGVSPSYLQADWLFFELNRDGELFIEANGVETIFTGGHEVTADITMLYSPVEDSARFEGGVILYNLETEHGVEFPHLNLVVGAGEFQGEDYFYLAAGGEGSFNGYTLGGSLLAGTVDPNSQVLLDMGYDHVLAKFNKDVKEGSFDGFYFSVIGEFPLVNFGCLLRATAGFDVRGWYFISDADSEVYGGAMGGSVSGTVACLISAKGKLSLQLERLPEGGNSIPVGWGHVSVPCTDPDGCMGFSGSFFLAMGFGFDCDPGSWDEWDDRWWGDSWCYTFGAGVGLAGVTEPGGGMEWDYDYDVDFE